MKPPLTFLLSLTFVFLFSGSSAAGLFSPDDWTECIFKNVNKLINKFSTVKTLLECKSKFPQKPIKGNSGLFGPKNYDDCISKYGKEVTSISGYKLMIMACAVKFKKFKKENSEKKEDKKEETTPVESEEQTDIYSEPWSPSVFDMYDYSNKTRPPEEPPTYGDCEILKDYKEEKSRHDELTAMGVDSPTPYIPLPERLEKIDYAVCGKKFPGNFE